jgi:hypothetical protein
MQAYRFRWAHRLSRCPAYLTPAARPTRPSKTSIAGTPISPPHGEARDQLGFPRTAACCDANGDCGGQGTRRDTGLLAQRGHACTRSHPMTAPANQRRSQQGVPPLPLRRGHAGTARQGHAHRPTCGRPEARRPQAQRNCSLPIRAASSGDTFCLTTTVFLALTAEPVSRAPCGRRDWS